MTSSTLPQGTADQTPATDSGDARRGVSVLLYSNDPAIRDQVRVAVGDRPEQDVLVDRWHEVATPAAALMEAQAGGYDVLVLDGESQPYGGMGVCRQLKSEIFDCPPVLVLTGRPGDGWLATWSLADAVLTRPLDEESLRATIADLARR